MEAEHRAVVTALDASPVGTVFLDGEFMITWLNQPIEEFLGVSRDGILGTDKVSKIKSDFEHIFENPDRFEELVLANCEDNTYVESFECHVLPDEDRKERWLRHRSAPSTDGKYEGGRIEHYSDITERKAVEKERQRSEAKYRSLFEDARDAIMLLDDGGYFDCNEMTLELFGFDSVEAFTERTPWELSPEKQPDGTDSQAAAQTHIRAAFEDGEAFFEWVHTRSDGTEFPAEVKLSRFQLDGEVVLRTLVRDITERREYEQKLEEATKQSRNPESGSQTRRTQRSANRYCVRHPSQRHVRNRRGERPHLNDSRECRTCRRTHRDGTRNGRRDALGLS